MFILSAGKEKDITAMRKSRRKKLFAILLTLCMVLTMMPSAVFATEMGTNEP